MLLARQTYSIGCAEYPWEDDDDGQAMELTDLRSLYRCYASGGRPVGCGVARIFLMVGGIDGASETSH